MKSFKYLIVAVCVCGLLAGSSLAEDKGNKRTCCEKAATEGKQCRNKCCVAAHKEGKSCKKCNPQGEDLKLNQKKGGKQNDKQS